MVNDGRLLPWHDTPQCKAERTEYGTGRKYACGGPMVPVRDMANGYGGGPSSRIACSACGEGIVGTAEEVARAERASTAFRAYEREEVHPDRGCSRCNAALPLERFRLCAPCVEKDTSERQ